jgi:hypothetical protein
MGRNCLRLNFFASGLASHTRRHPRATHAAATCARSRVWSAKHTAILTPWAPPGKRNISIGSIGDLRRGKQSEPNPGRRKNQRIVVRLPLPRFWRWVWGLPTALFAQGPAFLVLRQRTASPPAEKNLFFRRRGHQPPRNSRAMHRALAPEDSSTGFFPQALQRWGFPPRVLRVGLPGAVCARGTCFFLHSPPKHANRSTSTPPYFSGWFDGSGGASGGSDEIFFRRFVELGGGVGAASPAVSDPRPNFCSVNASSLPVGVSPCALWNCFIASAVESSHFPVGVPVNTPFFANAS